MRDLRRWSDDHAPRRSQGNLLPDASGVDDRSERQGRDFGLRPIRAERRRKLTVVFKHSAKITLARVGDYNRSLSPFVVRVARAAMDGFSRPTSPAIVRLFRAVTKVIAKPRGKVRDGFGDIDPAAAGRAGAACAAISARYAGLVEEVSRNPGLSPTQRAAAISGLRAQQAAESRRCIENHHGGREKRRTGAA